MSENLEILIDYLKNGEKPKKNFKIGIEYEHFVLDKNTGFSCNYKRLEKIFRKLVKQKYYKPLYEKNKIISLINETESLTIEPGAQLEISITPQKKVSDILKIYNLFLKRITPLLEADNLFLISLGYHPIQRNQDIEFVPKKRYKFMSDYFKRTGSFGLDMMKSTNTIHINIDYKSELDFKQKFFITQCLAPISNLFFSNSPFVHNYLSDKFFRRVICWLNTDPERCGFIEEGFDYKNFGYKKYAEHVLNTPMIVSLKNNKYKWEGHKTYFEFLKTNKLTKENMENQFSMLFPIIRAKQHLEIRLSDGLKYKDKMIPILFWKGLLYNQKNIDYIMEIVSEWTFCDIKQLYFLIMNNGYNIDEFKNIKFNVIIDKILELCYNGLTKNEQKQFDLYYREVIKQKKTLSELEQIKYLKTGLSVLEYIKKDYYV